MIFVLLEFIYLRSQRERPEGRPHGGESAAACGVLPILRSVGARQGGLAACTAQRLAASRPRAAARLPPPAA